ncbi:hypothetical protein [Pseudorhodoferax sp.]|uniref:hypothetical protein n=1 Tax=Pseudorhodoferax sp. TaxID=1993553 RepID=UPI002DD6413E|nr:hypothetical protein [Pseudorhodoferax sp.]
MDPRRATPAHWLLGATSGLLVWASSFTVLYASLSLGCEAGWHTRTLAGANLLTLVLALAWAAHLLVLAALWRHFGRWPREDMRRWLARTLTGIGLAATVWTGWPLLALPPCAGQQLALEEAACSTS